MIGDDDELTVWIQPGDGSATVYGSSNQKVFRNVVDMVISNQNTERR